MRFTLTVKLEWDKAQEDLQTFRKRYEGLKEHMQHLQLQGTLPRGDLRWIVTTKSTQLPPKPDDYDDPDDDGSVGAAVHLPRESQLYGSFFPSSPVMMHYGGSRLM